MPQQPTKSQADGRAIRTRRAELDLPTATLASQVNIAEGSLRNIENGRFSPSLRLLYRLARALGVPAEELMVSGTNDGVPDEPPKQPKPAPKPPPRRDKDTKGPRRAQDQDQAAS